MLGVNPKHSLGVAPKQKQLRLFSMCSLLSSTISDCYSSFLDSVTLLPSISCLGSSFSSHLFNCRVAQGSVLVFLLPSPPTIPTPYLFSAKPGISTSHWDSFYCHLCISKDLRLTSSKPNPCFSSSLPCPTTFDLNIHLIVQARYLSHLWSHPLSHPSC